MSSPPSPVWRTSACFFLLYYLFPRTSLWVMVPLGLLYAFLHQRQHQRRLAQLHPQPVLPLAAAQPALRRGRVRRLLLLADLLRRGAHAAPQGQQRQAGRTGRDHRLDWISIYRHGHDDEAENVWSYTFLSFFRDNPAAISRELKKRGETEVRWGNIELAMFILILITMASSAATARS